MKRNKDISVSILVPVYGVEKFIERCARSLFEQTYEHLEYIFVDDCSPDNSIGILNQVLEDYPHRKPHVRIVRHERNRGLAAARNTAVDNCNTEFLMHVDSDDYIDKNLIEKCVYEQKSADSDIVFSDFKKHNFQYVEIERYTDVGDTHEMTNKMLLAKERHNLWGNLIRTRLYKDNGISAIEGINMGEDFYVMPRLVYQSSKLGFIHDSYYHYVFQNTNSYAFTYSREKNRQVLVVYDGLQNYFAKDPLLSSSLNLHIKKNIPKMLLKCIKADDKENYNELSLKLRNISENSCSSITCGQKIAFFLGCSSLGRLYVSAAYKVKDFGRLVKSKIKKREICTYIKAPLQMSFVRNPPHTRSLSGGYSKPQ